MLSVRSSLQNQAFHQVSTSPVKQASVPRSWREFDCRVGEVGKAEAPGREMFCLENSLTSCPVCSTEADLTVVLLPTGLRRGRLPLHHQGDHNSHGQLHLPRPGPRAAVPDPRPAGEWLVNGSVHAVPSTLLRENLTLSCILSC